MIFPLLCHTDREIAQFIDFHQKLSRGNFYRLDLTEGPAALVLVSGFQRGVTTNINYVIPTDWKERYQIIQAAVVAIKTEAKQQGIDELFTGIVESVPSHNGYYAGMLPLMGFEMAPRVRLVAPFGVLDTLELPQLPDGIEEAGFLPEKLAEVSKVWYQAEIEHYADRSEVEKERMRADNVRDVERWSGSEDRIKTCTTLLLDGRVIGFSVGLVGRSSETLDVLELHVLPAFQGRGLGRYLCIRCMQKLHECFAESGWRFFVGTFRDWLPAVRLYSSLSFRLDDKAPSVIIYATCKLGTQG